MTGRGRGRGGAKRRRSEGTTEAPGGKQRSAPGEGTRGAASREEGGVDEPQTRPFGTVWK
jgi:hypothetical protein